jgi:hypothetical protein
MKVKLDSLKNIKTALKNISLYAVLALNANDIGDIQGIGPLGQMPVGANVGTINDKFAELVSIVIGFLTFGGAMWFVFQIILGGITWIGSGNDKNQIQTSQKRITNAVIGLIILISAMVIIQVIGFVFGIDILNINFSAIVN